MKRQGDREGEREDKRRACPVWAWARKWNLCNHRNATNATIAVKRETQEEERNRNKFVCADKMQEFAKDKHKKKKHKAKHREHSG